MRKLQEISVLAIAVAAYALGLGFIMSACGADTPLTATVVVSPTPSPTQTPDPRLSCIEDNFKLRVVNGAGNDDILFDFRETITAMGSPRNAVDAVLPDSCDYPRVVGWSGTGPGLHQLGDATGFVSFWKFEDPGTFSIIATHGKFKAIWNGLLIRDNGVGGAITYALDKFGDPRISIRVYRDGQPLHAYRLISHDWKEVPWASLDSGVGSGG